MKNMTEKGAGDAPESVLDERVTVTLTRFKKKK